MAAYLTFDLGTTALKTALIGSEGNMLTGHSVEYTHHCPQPDWMEMEPEAYWDAAVQGASAVLGRAGASAAEIAAIGFSSQGQTFVPINAKGEALYRAIIWLDKRAQDVADAWQSGWLSTAEFRRGTGYPWVPGELTLFKIGWLAENAPQAHQAEKFLCLPDYLIYRLTGETAIDYNLAQMSGMYDLQTGAWEPEWLKAAGITAGQLPAVHAPGTVVGRTLAGPAKEMGIAEGVPVCLGANDQLVGAVGAGNVRPGLVTETTGTALAVVATTESLLEDESMFVGRHAVPDLCYAMPFGNASAIILKWFRDMCDPGTDYEAFLAGVEQIPPGCDGLTLLPHFSGTASPSFNPDARGALAGLTLGHSRAHIARAVMESCACLLQEVMDPILAHEIEVRTIRSLGGAARSDLWLQMKADLLGVPVERPACSEAASLGAAMLAATGVGQFSTLAEAADAWYRADRTFEPNDELFDTYRGVYKAYLDLYQRLYGGAD